MPSSVLRFEFAAPVLKFTGGTGYHHIPISTEMADAFRGQGIRRLIATLNGVPIRRALMNTAEGEFYLIVGLTTMREIGAVLGDLVTVDLEADPDPDRIDLGPAFKAALDADGEAATRFFAMTPGRQRSLASYVTSAKREETQIKRALELTHKLRTHTLYGDG